MPGGKAVQDEVNERMRGALRRLMSSRAWDQKRTGKEFDVTQQTISSFLARRTGASLHLAWSIAQALGISLDELLGGAAGRSVWRDLPGWSDATAHARKLFPRISDSAWEWLGSLSGPPVPGLAPALLGIIAGVWDQGEHQSLEGPRSSEVRVKKGSARR